MPPPPLGIFGLARGPPPSPRVRPPHARPSLRTPSGGARALDADDEERADAGRGVVPPRGRRVVRRTYYAGPPNEYVVTFL